jgi:hypothetical protein
MPPNSREAAVDALAVALEPHFALTQELSADSIRRVLDAWLETAPFSHEVMVQMIMRLDKLVKDFKGEKAFAHWLVKRAYEHATGGPPRQEDPVITDAVQDLAQRIEPFFQLKQQLSPDRLRPLVTDWLKNAQLPDHVKDAIRFLFEEVLAQFSCSKAFAWRLALYSG